MANKHKRLVKKKGPEMVLNVLSNDPQANKYDLLQMFYQGAFENTIAYMDAEDPLTGDIVPVLCGISRNTLNNKIDVFPLARILDQDEATRLQAPSGHGDYFNYAGQKEIEELPPIVEEEVDEHESSPLSA